MELHIYDFDQTLFKSPYRPEGKSDEQWWPVSLSPPFVPKNPSSDWWNIEIVESAKKSIADPNVMAILATGRTWDYFPYRVEELLHQQGLYFSGVFFTDPQIPTKEYKSSVFSQLNDRFNFESVHIWDDRDDYFPQYAALFQVPVYCHHVKGANPMSFKNFLIRKAYHEKDLRPLVLEILKESSSRGHTDPIDIIVPLEKTLQSIHSDLINGHEGRLLYLRKVLLNTLDLIKSFFAAKGMRLASSNALSLKEIPSPISPESGIAPDMVFQKVSAYRELMSNLQQIVQWGQSQAWRTVMYKKDALDRVSIDTLTELQQQLQEWKQKWDNQ